MGSSFRWLLASTASGSLAHGVAIVALPLLLVSLTTDPLVVALLPVASGLPWLMFSLHAGALVDRVDRRLVLWAADASRAVLATVLVTLLVVEAVSVGALMVLAFVEGVATVAFRAASPAVVPALVDRDELTRANSHVHTGTVIMGGFLGPALGGVLYPLSPIAPFAVQSASMIASTGCLRRLPAQPTVTDLRGPATLAAGIREGLRSVIADRVLRSLVASTALLAAATGMLEAVLVLHVIDALRAPEQTYGLLLVVNAAGCLLGTGITPRMRYRLGSRACLVLAAALGVTSLLAIAAAPSAHLAGIGMGLLGVGSMIYNVTAVTVRQERTSNQLLGRVSSVANLAGAGTLPIAALFAGSIAAASSTAAALLVAALICGGGLTWLLLDTGPTGAKGNEQAIGK